MTLSGAQFGKKEKQLELPIGHGSARLFPPVAAAVKGARDLTGGRYQPPPEDMQVSPRVGLAIAHEYRRNEHAPVSPSTRRSYDAMISETGHQYEHMIKPVEQGGLGIHHEVTKHDPYGSPQDLAADLHQGRIKTMSSATTGGHAYFSDEQNDKFRAVHDFFGHGATGRGFSRHGEEAAWSSHAQMYSPEAREAMTSETRGQNSFLNYGPTGDFPDNGVVSMSQFAQSPHAKDLEAEIHDKPLGPASHVKQPHLPGVR